LEPEEAAGAAAADVEGGDGVAEGGEDVLDPAGVVGDAFEDAAGEVGAGVVEAEVEEAGADVGVDEGAAFASG